MDTLTWGPATWILIHSIALAYPESDPSSQTKDGTRMFFQSLETVLPCSICREHYKTNLVLSELNRALESRWALFSWTVDLHNKVNRSLGKREWTYEEALQALSKTYRQPRSSLKKKDVVIIIVLITIFCAAVSLYLYCLYHHKPRYSMGQPY